MQQSRESHQVSRIRRSRESGQTTIFVLLILGLFLIGFAGLAVDWSNIYFRRQAAQGAADAACQAGAMDMLVAATGGTVNPGFSPSSPTAFDCTGSTAVPCRYAQLNGYGSNGLIADTESNLVHVSFPPRDSYPDIEPPDESLAAHPYIRVDVTDRTKMFFTPMLTGTRTYDVKAHAVCGLQQAQAPIPIIVLHPTCQHSFQVSGSATLTIVGGPSRSVQVNSENPTCAAATQASANSCSGSGTIDLSHGGPNFSGSNFGVWGSPGDAPSNFDPGTTGAWLQPASPISDPFATVPPPDPTGMPVNPAVTHVNYNVDGCPNHEHGCDVYHPGLYTNPITIKGTTVLFAPGIYYIQPTTYTGDATGGGYCGEPGSGCISKPTGQCRGDLVLLSGSVVRPRMAPGDEDQGVTFYFSGNSSTGQYGSVVITSNSGTSSDTIDSFDTNAVNCPGADPPDSSLGLPSSVPGNVLLGPCTKKGTYIGAPGESVGPGRGLLFFGDRANGDINGQPNMQGGGGLVLSGTMYFHNTGTNNAFLQLQGTPGSGTFILGEIVTDELVQAGNGSIAMQLSPYAILEILKVSLLK